jgi:hypothetical protein
VRTGAAIVAALTALVAAPARAAPGAELLDADAALWIRLDAAPLAAVADELTRRAGPAGASLRRGVEDAVVAAIGGSPLTPDGWRALGLDPARPVLAAVGAIDEAALLGATGLTGTLLGGPAPPRNAAPRRGPGGVAVWRSRALLPVLDAARARATVARLSAALPVVAVERAHAAAIGRLVGALGDAGGDAAARLGRAGVLALAPGPRGGIVAIALHGRWLVVDELVPVGRPLRWHSDADRVLRLLARRATARASSPPLRHLDVAGVSALLIPARFTAAVLWSELAAAPLTRAGIERVRLRCATTAAVTARGPLGDLGATLRARPGALEVDATWAVAAPLAGVLAATRPAPLPRAGDLDGTAASLRSHVASWAPLAGLSFAGFTADLPPRLAACHPALAALALAYGWPHRIGALARNLTRAEPEAGPLIAGLGPFVAVVHDLPAAPEQLRDLHVSVEVAIAPAIVPALTRLADLVWGPGRGDAGLRRWGQGRLRAFARTGPPPTAGLAVGTAAAGHGALPRAAGPASAHTVFELRLAAAALTPLTPLAALAGEVAARARWDAGALRIDLQATAP